MKNSKLSFSIDSAIKLCIAMALVVAAATKQQYSYYNFLRWLIMISFAYFCYKSYGQKQFGLLIFFGIVAIMFNPFQKFWFQKQIWNLIDYLIAGVIALTIIYDWLLFVKAKND